jgi:hypothetical protein
MTSRPDLRLVTPETTGKEQGRADERTRFKPGQSGNPGGRPKGTRHKLSEDFFEALLECWQEGGRKALARVRDEQPVEYCKLIARVISKDAGTGAALPGIDDWPDSLEAVRGFLEAHASDGEEVDPRANRPQPSTWPKL